VPIHSEELSMSMLARISVPFLHTRIADHGKQFRILNASGNQQPRTILALQQQQVHNTGGVAHAKPHLLDSRVVQLTLHGSSYLSVTARGVEACVLLSSRACGWQQ
jgi:hypothetical protein